MKNYKIVGVGLAKTGTKTLGLCLRHLGYKHKSIDLSLFDDDLIINNNPSKVLQLVNQYESFDDYPFSLFFREIDKIYPDSKFILTTRSNESWIRSYRNMLKKYNDYNSNIKEIRRYIYGFDDIQNVTDNQLISRINKHNDDVRKYFKNRKNLIEVNWEDGDSWHSICSFLNHEIPKIAFPHSNKGNY